MVRIGLVQINNSFSGQNYLPYSIACLQSYAEHRLPPGKFNFLPMIYKRIPVFEIVARLEGADVIGFSACGKRRARRRGRRQWRGSSLGACSSRDGGTRRHC